MKVRVTDDAASDLRIIKTLLPNHSVVVAERVLDRIANVIGRLSTFPRLGHLGIVDGTLERISARTSYVLEQAPPSTQRRACPTSSFLRFAT